MLCLSTLLRRWTTGEDVSALDERVETVEAVSEPVATDVINETGT